VGKTGANVMREAQATVSVGYSVTLPFPSESAAIYRIAAPIISTSLVTPFAGSPGVPGFADGVLNTARFSAYNTMSSNGGLMGFGVSFEGTVFIAVSCWLELWQGCTSCGIEDAAAAEAALPHAQQGKRVLCVLARTVCACTCVFVCQSSMRFSTCSRSTGSCACKSLC
jgi:hypothetical protein